MEFTQLLHNSGWMELSGICQTYTKNTAYRAWFYPLRKIMGISLNDTQESSWQKITKAIAYYTPELEVFAPLIADILSIEHISNPLVKSLDAKTKREKRIYTVCHLFKAIAAKNPVVIFFDNAQWLDHSSLELFNKILSLKDSPILFCLTSRDKLDSDIYQNVETLTSMELAELSNTQAKQLLTHYEVSPEFIEKIIELAKGNPLFLEELARSNTLLSGELPETVYDVVMSRLDQLDNMKKSLLKNASVIGQIFDSSVLNSLPAVAKEYSSEPGRT